MIWLFYHLCIEVIFVPKAGGSQIYESLLVLDQHWIPHHITDLTGAEVDTPAAVVQRNSNTILLYQLIFPLQMLDIQIYTLRAGDKSVYVFVG